MLCESRVVAKAYFFSAVCSNRNCTSLWVDCASACENHLLINGVYMYGPDISKTRNTAHHWKMKNFKVRKHVTGQLTCFLGKNTPVQHQKFVLMQHFTKHWHCCPLSVVFLSGSDSNIMWLGSMSGESCVWNPLFYFRTPPLFIVLESLLVYNSHMALTFQVFLQ